MSPLWRAPRLLRWLTRLCVARFRKGAAGVADAIALLDEYGLSRDDWLDTTEVRAADAARQPTCAHAPRR